MNKKITGQIIISPQTISNIEKKVKNLSGFKKNIESVLEENITEVLENILIGAINLNASDIHIEPRKKEIKIRIRIDGMLQEIISLDKKIFESLLSRIKLLSALKLNVSDRPQDGRFSIISKQETIEIRVSSLPSEYGESIVLRILNPKSLIEVEGLGLRKDLLELFLKEIKKPNGMIIVTGPTGSGKTTTLYAFLKRIKSPEAKVITIEDPIEYHLKGISQTQVEPEKGYDFSNGLRSIMRQDPDAILVGEIRDTETAKIAIQSALTGHLVLTTLHTNDAAGTIARLINLGAKPVNIGPAVNMIIAQRLVRKICKKCAKLEKASILEVEKLKNGLKSLSKEISYKIDSDLKILKPNGCKDCNNTGYKGRTGIFEAILIDDVMENFILENPSISALRKAAFKKGMATMKQDGFLKVLNKETTIEEIERVAGE
ncbi:type II/IV secretion system protein [Candidatus Parcubacteria bacterium]|nr:type II/IV secretion system protein [Candidatus Parcubacteria bacterium]